MAQLPIAIVLILTVLIPTPLIAADDLPRLAVLDFELRDLTPIPETPEELERTAAVGPLLRQALAKGGELTVVEVDGKTHGAADVAVGYLFDRPSVAAQLGRSVDADLIAVGRVHKPSFLFAYLMVHLIDTRDNRLVGDYVVEIKGPGENVLQGGVDSLARQMHQTISTD